MSNIPWEQKNENIIGNERKITLLLACLFAGIIIMMTPILLVSLVGYFSFHRIQIILDPFKTAFEVILFPVCFLYTSYCIVLWVIYMKRRGNEIKLLAREKGIKYIVYVNCDYISKLNANKTAGLKNKGIKELAIKEAKESFNRYYKTGRIGFFDVGLAKLQQDSNQEEREYRIEVFCHYISKIIDDGTIKSRNIALKEAKNFFNEHIKNEKIGYYTVIDIE